MEILEILAKILGILLFGFIIFCMSLSIPLVSNIIYNFWIRVWIEKKKEKKLRERLREVESLPVPILLKTIKDEELLVRHKKEKLPFRLKAIQVLGDRGDPSAVEPLIHLLSDVDPKIRQKAIIALGFLGDYRAVDPLIKALRDTSTSFSKTKEALVMLGVPPENIHSSGKVFPNDHEESQTMSVEEWVGKLNDKDWQVRWKAAKNLGKIGDACAVESLIKTLKDKDWSVRLEATEALGKIDDARVATPLVNMLKDNNMDVCVAAERVLRKIGAPAIGPLIYLLGDSDPNIREKTVKVLRSIRDNRIIEPLIRSLGDSDSDVRKEAVKVLKEIGVPVVEHLAKTVESNDENVRWKAAKALGTIGAITPLMNMMDDKDRKVQVYVMKVLKKAFVSVDTVIFREGEFKKFDQSTRLINPEVSKLTIPMSELKRVVIYTEAYDFHQVERFMTYAVNYIGQKHLKKHVEVHIYGDPEKLHPNLRNTFKNLCKCVNVHEKNQE